jgi:hypothetical protein
MPFFFIIPVWLLLVAVGLILLFFARFRILGYFVIAVPTGATVTSFLLSTSVFFVVPRLLPMSSRPWYGLLILAVYVVALLLGGLLGAIGAFSLVLKLQKRYRN